MVKEAKVLLRAYFSLSVVYFYSLLCFTCLPLRVSLCKRGTGKARAETRAEVRAETRAEVRAEAQVEAQAEAQVEA